MSSGTTDSLFNYLGTPTYLFISFHTPQPISCSSADNQPEADCLVKAICVHRLRGGASPFKTRMLLFFFLHLPLFLLTTARARFCIFCGAGRHRRWQQVVDWQSEQHNIYLIKERGALLQLSQTAFLCLLGWAWLSEDGPTARPDFKSRRKWSEEGGGCLFSASGWWPAWYSHHHCSSKCHYVISESFIYTSDM